MARRHTMFVSALFTFVLVGTGLAGCVDAPDPAPDPSWLEQAAELGRHPFPDGDEGWPENLTGPFDLGRTVTGPVNSFDGTPLEVTVYVPDLPDGVKAPVVLSTSPYYGGCGTAVAGAAVYGGVTPCAPPTDVYTTSRSLLVEHGFAVALASVRGTGNSGGCLEWGSTADQRDQVHLIGWLAEQEWSNGHVAMKGSSGSSWPAWQAAVHAPDALKTIVTGAFVTDPYLGPHSPQGAVTAEFSAFLGIFTTSINFVPPAGAIGNHGPQGAAGHLAEHASVFPDRACPAFADTMTETAKGQFTDMRNGDFYDERRLVTRAPDVTAAVLGVAGFLDTFGFAWQDDDIWHSLPEDTPKRLILGPWGHRMAPPARNLDFAPFGDWYGDTYFPWLDYWLKGIGDRSDLYMGNVHYQDQEGDWHASTAWPPADAVQEVLYLAPAGRLTPEPAEGSVSFSTIPDFSGPAAVCPDALPAGIPSAAAMYLSEPVDEPVRLAGNPYAYLQLESDLPGGTVSLDLFSVAADGGCEQEPLGFTHVSEGAADLRFHRGNYQGEDYPVGAPEAVRLDIYNHAWTFEPGERLAVVVSGDGHDGKQGQPYYPLITLHGDDGPEASHVVLPIVNGTLGGDAPTLDYPPQPFLPDGMGG